MNEKSEALRLAEWLDGDGGGLTTLGDCAAELRRLHQHEVALSEWLDKTSWLQETARPGELGMHRADAMRARMLKAEAQRDALLEACRAYDKWADKTLCYDRELRPIRAQIRAAIKAVEEEK